ncbi:MAG TPA: L-histidine N(alpha)-methyltransferase [Candidatus Saccharimonadales bacterium]|nr:L-histidine N(alpha)-methyltransferase [Candidatus Saccharimonadales bacterium]
MKYFKNTELAEQFHVSEKSVRNWIDASQAGKLDLQLYEVNGRSYIADITKNINVIKELVTRGEKYKNKRGYKVVSPRPEFYELFDAKQIVEIISSINFRKEIPMQFNYVNAGADAWNDYANRLDSEESANILKSCRELLESNLDSLDRLIGNYKRVNIIDLGVGNALPVKGLLQHFIEKGLLNRYIGIDLSKNMLDIAEGNLVSWFGNKPKFEFYERDFTHDEFGDILADDYMQNKDIPINLILLFGGTIGNFAVPDDVLRIINRSMQPDDLFICELKLDTPNSRQFFDFYSKPSQVPTLARHHRTTINLLNLDESMYDVVFKYDEAKNERFIGAKLKIDVSIKIHLNSVEHLIKLHKGDTIQVFRYRHLNAAGVNSLFHKNGFEVLQTSQSRDYEYFLSIAGRS